jgi:hypothetical protein
MAKSRQSLSARISHATGRRRKKPTSRVERAFDEVKQLVSGTGGRLLGRSSQGKATTKQVSAKKSGAARIRSGQQRQAAAKKSGAARVRSGQQRQATTKKAARSRGAKTS